MTHPAAPTREPASRHWPRQLALMLILTGLLIAATGARWEFAAAGVTLSAVSLGFFSFAFPGGLHFGLTMANFLTVYGCLFAFFRDSNFAGTNLIPTVIALILPVVVFLLRCFFGRRHVAKMIHTRQHHELAHLPRLARWLPGVAVVAAASFALPQLGLPPVRQDVLLLAGMAVISGFVAMAQQDLILLMMDVAMVFETIAGRIDRMMMPIMAFLTFYSLLVVVFACLYRIAERSLSAPQFFVHGAPGTISFPDAIYFSVITISTVGYGDIAPDGPLVRAIAALEVVCGLLLLLFGFAEIMRSGGPESEQRQSTRLRSRQKTD